MKKISQSIIPWFLVFSVVSSFGFGIAKAQEKRVINPISKFFGEIVVEIGHAIKASFTQGELEFIATHRQIFFPSPDHPSKNANEGQCQHLKIISEWIAAGHGEVDMSFPMLTQMVSITQMNNKIDELKELPLQKIIEFPALNGGTNILTWTRVDCQGKKERLEFSGVFRIKTNEGEYGLARAFRVVQLDEGEWKTIKKDFQWIQKLK